MKLKCSKCGKELDMSSFHIGRFPRCKRNRRYYCKQCTYTMMSGEHHVVSLLGEEWRTIEEFPNFCVSNFGRVKRVRTQTGNLTEKLMTQHIQRAGYNTVALAKDSYRKNCFVHRLVATAFIPNEEQKPQVNHKNGIRNDNRLENLEWVTCSENGLHAYKVLNVVPNTIGRFGKDANRHIAVDAFLTNGEFVKRFETITEASRELNVNSGSIVRCAKGEYKQTHGYVFKYVK